MKNAALHSKIEPPAASEKRATRRSPVELSSQQRKLAGPFEFYRAKNEGGFNDSQRFAVPTSRAEYWSSLQSEHEQSQEIGQQILGIRDRITTLKIHLVARILWGKDAGSFDGVAHAAFKAINDLKYLDGEKPEDDARRAKAVKDFNTVAPERYRIPYIDRLSRWQYKVFGDIAQDTDYQNRAPKDLRIKLEALLDKVNQKSRELGEELEPRLIAGEQDLIGARRNAWRSYRELVKEIADTLENPNWFSPTYGAGVLGEKGHNQASEPFSTDYQRWNMHNLTVLERRLGPKLHALKDSSADPRHMIFGSGIQAFEAALKGVVTEQLRENKKILTFPSIYFETENRLSKFCQQHDIKLETISDLTEEGIRSTVLREKPAVIFTGTIGLGKGLPINPTRTLFRALLSEKFQIPWSKGQRMLGDRPILIVVDNSSTSLLPTWQNRAFPKRLEFMNLKLAVCESLAKFATDGVEVSGGGLLTTIGCTPSITERGLSGLVPAPSQVLRLELGISPDKLAEKMERHSRNATLLAEALESGTKANPAWISKVDYPFLASHPHHELAKAELAGGGAIITVGFNASALSQSVRRFMWLDASPIPPHERSAFMDRLAEAFQKTVGVLATAAEIDLNHGTSYGLNVTRTAIYHSEWPKKFHKLLGNRLGKGEPYMRIAVGTEDRRSIELISQVILRANEIFTELISTGEMELFADALLGRNTPGSWIKVNGKRVEDVLER